MQLSGKWLLCSDGVTRPVLAVAILGGDGGLHKHRFLVDSGADSTLLSADFLKELQLTTQPAPAGIGLVGVGGQSDYVTVQATLQLQSEQGVPIKIHGTFAATTNPLAVDRSILGRDVTDLFSVIYSRPRNEVLLLSGNHRYEVSAA